MKKNIYAALVLVGVSVSNLLGCGDAFFKPESKEVYSPASHPLMQIFPSEGCTTRPLTQSQNIALITSQEQTAQFAGQKEEETQPSARNQITLQNMQQKLDEATQILSEIKQIIVDRNQKK